MRKERLIVLYRRHFVRVSLLTLFTGTWAFAQPALAPQANIWDSSDLKMAQRFCTQFTQGGSWNTTTNKCEIASSGGSGITEQQACDSVGGTYDAAATPKCQLPASTGPLDGYIVQSGIHRQVARVSVTVGGITYGPVQRVNYPRAFLASECKIDKMVIMITRERFWGQNEEMPGVRVNEDPRYAQPAQAATITQSRFFGYEGDATDHTDKKMFWMALCPKN